MKLFSTEAQAAIEDGTAMVSGAIEILCDPVFRVFGGYGTLALNGHDFTGIGDRGLVQASGVTLGGTAQGVKLALSGVEPSVADMVDEDAVGGAVTTLWRLIFDGAGRTLLDAQIFDRGKVDQLLIEEEIGGTATITVSVETAARALGRKGGRMRTDADQRLINSNDGGFRNVSFAAQKTLYWGGRKPANAGAALGATAPRFDPLTFGGIF